MAGWTCLATLLACVAGLASATAEEVRFGTTVFPPYAKMENGEIVGPAIDVLARVAHKAGLEPVFPVMPAKRIAYEFLAGKIDIWPAPVSAELADQVIVGDVVSTVGVSIVWRPGTPPLTALGGLAGGRLIANYGYSYLDVRDRLAALDPPIEIIDVSDLGQVPGLLDAGRARYVLVYDSMLADPILATGPRFERLPLRKADFRFLAARSNPRGQELVDRLDAAYRALPPELRFNAQWPQ